jgi:hypothetical protein
MRQRENDEVSNVWERQLRRARCDSFFPARCGEAAALRIGVCDHRHQGVAMKAMPGSAFEVVEAQFFVDLLMRLLANPARFDRRGERFEVSVGGAAVCRDASLCLRVARP